MKRRSAVIIVILLVAASLLGGCSRAAEHDPEALIPGVFNGQVDGHTIELATENSKAASFQLADEVKPLFDSSSASYKDFKTGDKVSFKYIVDSQGQQIITFIEKDSSGQ